MNICFLSQEYPPETHVGGIGTYTYNMATALAKLDHTVHVITSTDRFEKTVQDNGVIVHYIKRIIIKPLELSHLIYSFQVAKKIRTLTCYFDIIHASEYANEALWISFNKQYPLVTRLATPFYLAEELNGKILFGPRPLFSIMEKWQTVHSAGIFSSTHALANKVMEKWHIDQSRVKVIPNSINLTRVNSLAAENSIPDILKNRKYLLYFGRLEKRKGVDVLARSLTAVFKQFPSLTMVFIGSDSTYQKGSMKDYILKTSGEFKDNLIFFENQPHEKLFPTVKFSKIVILPSLWEAFGFVCIEAMTLGCPVIATAGSGFGEIIEDSVSGYLVEPGNSEALADRIIWCLNNEGDLGRVSNEAIKRAQDFEVSKIALQLISYYSSIKESWEKNKRTAS